jgi:hypothetical protein
VVRCVQRRERGKGMFDSGQVAQATDDARLDALRKVREQMLRHFNGAEYSHGEAAVADTYLQIVRAHIANTERRIYEAFKGGFYG